MGDFPTVLLVDTAWLEWGGTTLITALVFVETGFLLGLIIPGGETLLFTAGLLTGVRTLSLPLLALIAVLVVAAILGDLTGYFIGRKLGDRLHQLPDTFLFKRRYLEKSDALYQKHPRRALLVGRFLPIIRTFNPLLAASSGLPLPRFLLLTSLSCVAYVSSLVLAGYWLGQQFPQIGQYVEYIFLGVVLLVIGTLVVQRLREPKESKMPEKTP